MNFFDEASVLKIATDATMITAVAGFFGRIFWWLATWATQWFEEKISRAPKTIEIVISKMDGIFDKQKTRPQCLLVRYGTDQYIEHMASDAERYAGRLRNEIIDIEVVKDATTSVVHFVLKLPVHQRMGTQFKCYVDVLDRSRHQAAIDFLNSSEYITDVTPSAGPSGEGRLYFLLQVAGCTVVQTVDGFENNMCFPH